MQKMDDKQFNITMNYSESIVGQGMNITFLDEVLDKWNYTLNTTSLYTPLNNHII